MGKRFRLRVFGLPPLLVLFPLAVCLQYSPASGFEFKGFSDITYSYTDNKQDTTDANPNGSFTLGQFDLYLAHTIGDRLDVLSELVVEADSGGEFHVDLERLQISYIFDDALIVRAGRFHNLLGYWNMAYHHGAQLQTTIERPQFLKFEDDGGILPVHLVGLWVGGRLSTAPAALVYGFMVGNGPRIKEVDTTTTPITPGVLDPNSITDNNKNKAVSFTLNVMPSAIDSLRIGLSGNFGRIQFFDATGTQIPVSGAREIDQEILSADLEYLMNNIELLSEFYQIRDHSNSTGTFLNYAWYVQGGYKIADRLTPYTRFERVTVHENDPYFEALGTQDFNKTIAGIRFDIIQTSSLKAEVRFVDSTDNYQEYGIQWAFAF